MIKDVATDDVPRVAVASLTYSTRTAGGGFEQSPNAASGTRTEPRVGRHAGPRPNRRSVSCSARRIATQRVHLFERRPRFGGLGSFGANTSPRSSADRWSVAGIAWA